MPSVKERPKHKTKKFVTTKIPKVMESIAEDKPFIALERSKKSLDIEELIPSPIIDIEEKLEDDPLSTETEGDLESDEPDLDDESLNPFGDKWEI
ncbi:MAG: hypothetical protein NTZ38_03540 [Candidatus Taylorbacteria bacterium]|nr:hypothetical protein [Candidatus Taylorbacteria bacterium]